MANTEQRERKEKVEAGDPAPCSNAEIGDQVAREYSRADHERKARRYDRSPDDRSKSSASVLYGVRVGFGAATDLQDLGARDTFRERQIGFDDQRAAQR